MSAPTAPDAPDAIDGETRFRTMADHAPVLLWMAGRDALCDFFNQSWLRFTGRTMAQELGVGWAAGVHAEDFQRCMHGFLDAFVARRAFSMAYRLRRHDGVYRWILDQGAPRFDADGSFAGFSGSCVDIHDLRQAQDDLRRLNDELMVRVREREVLLREVNHRVKNNLQVVASLLGMQARRLVDATAIEALLSCQSRVETIALVHEQIYQTADLSRIPFAPYARRLAAAVVRTATPAADTVGLELDLDDVVLPVERAIPCGMILHELVTNARRHAFPDGAAGTIRVGFQRIAPGRVELVVADDGVGLPPGLDVTTAASVGSRLISAFVDQLGARLAVERRDGTVVRVAFAIDDDGAPP